MAVAIDGVYRQAEREKQETGELLAQLPILTPIHFSEGV